MKETKKIEKNKEFIKIRKKEGTTIFEKVKSKVHSEVFHLREID